MMHVIKLFIISLFIGCFPRQIYIEAVLSQYINDQQQSSNLTLLWDGGGVDFLEGEILEKVYSHMT